MITGGKREIPSEYSSFYGNKKKISATHGVFYSISYFNFFILFLIGRVLTTLNFISSFISDRLFSDFFFFLTDVISSGKQRLTANRSGNYTSSTIDIVTSPDSNRCACTHEIYFPLFVSLISKQKKQKTVRYDTDFFFNRTPSCSSLPPSPFICCE